MMYGSGIVVQIVLVMAVGILAEQQATDSTVITTDVPSTPAPVVNATLSPVQAKERLDKLAKRMRDTVKIVKQATNPNGLLEMTVRTNFLHTLFLMANSSAIAGATVSRAAGTLIRGFVQDSFNLVSIGYYLPRLLFLDGPTQFIELLRLVRSNQLHIPRDVDEAIDTVINFATIARMSQISQNIGTPFLQFFPNVFRGAELLSTEVLYGVFQWLAPLSPTDISSSSVEGLWNRWDTRSSTTERYSTKFNFEANPAGVTKPPTQPPPTSPSTQPPPPPPPSQPFVKS